MCLVPHPPLPRPPPPSPLLSSGHPCAGTSERAYHKRAPQRSISAEVVFRGLRFRLRLCVCVCVCNRIYLLEYATMLVGCFRMALFLSPLHPPGPGDDGRWGGVGEIRGLWTGFMFPFVCSPFIVHNLITQQRSSPACSAFGSSHVSDRGSFWFSLEMATTSPTFFSHLC